MTTVFDANIVPILIALVLGLVIGWWIFKRTRSGGSKAVGEERTDQVAQEHAPTAPLTVRADTPEGNGLLDTGAAATADVAGEVLGVQVHSQLPGASGPPDNLSIMKGVGPKFVAKLNENGIIRFDQLAALSENEVSILDDKLGPFKGRLRRDRVTEQASYLMREDTDGFEARFGKLGSGV